jgi:hypothetical protein
VKSIRARFDSTRHSLASLTSAFRRRSGSVNRVEKRDIRSLRLERLEDRRLLSSDAIVHLPAPTSAPSSLPVSLAVPLGGGTSSPAGLIPFQIRQAYGDNFVNFADGSSGDGSGQTIAIVDAYHDPNIRSDLHAFDQQFGLADPELTIIDPDGVPPSPPPPDSRGFSWGLETALDVEWAHALAPGAAILLVETPGTDFGLLSGVNHARSEPGVSVVSMSWGENTVINNAVFETPAGHQGVTFVAGSGDAGSQADYPAFSPNVLAVGGTEFAKPLDAQGDYPGETAWRSGGGGVDSTEPQPAAQLQTVGAMGGRAIPDVSFDAGSDVAVLDSYDYGANPWISLEGTSFGAPAWAALIAIADQGRALAGAGSLDGSTQTIPELYAIARSKAYSSAFNDITSGSNDAYNANAGYDLVTGLGTPNAPLIVASLSHNVPGLHLIVPGAGSVVTATTTTFQWTPALGALSYNLTVVDTLTGVTVISQQNLTTTSFTPPGAGLTSADTYSWTVSAVTGDGQAAAAQPPNEFAVIPVPTPQSPSGISDFDAPTFTWSAVPGASGYDLQVFDTTTGTTAINTQVNSNNSYVPSLPLNNLDTYVWTVSAYINATNHGLPYASPPSGSVYFTVNLDVAPVPIAPANEADITTTTPTFEWSPVNGAVSYQITIVDFSEIPSTPTVLSELQPSYTPSVPLPNGYYQWSVQAFVSANGLITPTPSSDLSFFLITDVEEPVLLSPGPGAVVSTVSPTFSWSVSGQGALELSLFDLTNDDTFKAFDFLGTSYTFDLPLDNGHTYEWSIAFEFSSGPSAIFTVAVPGGGTQSLAAPTPISPSGVITTNFPTFQWMAVPGATEYAFSIGEGLPPVLVTGTSYTFSKNILVLGLSSGNYVWTVTAYDKSGDYSPRSIGQDIYVQTPGSTFVPAPTGLSPAGPVATNTPTLSWMPVPGANSYTFELFDEMTGTAIAGGEFFDNQTSYPIDPMEFGENPLPLVNGHTYRWYVCGSYFDGLNPSELGAVATQVFTVSAPAFGPPGLTAPLAGAIVTSTTPTFQWSAVTGATGYLFFLRDPTSTVPAAGIAVTDTSYTPTHSLIDDKTYEWQVIAILTKNGTTTYGDASPPREFTVSVPGQTTLETPADGGTIKVFTPNFQWSPVTGAAGYDFYLIDTTSGKTVLGGYPVASTSYTLGAPLVSGRSYQWYVRAFDNYGNIGLAPPALNFNVSVPPPVPVVPVLLSPIATITGATPTFKWTAVPGAVAYALFIEDIANGNIIAAGSHVYGLSYTPSSPLPGGDTTYDWYVQAIRSDGTLGPKPPDADFDVSTAPALPTAPAPISPNGSITTATPTFTWSPVTGALGYELEIFDTTNAKDVPVLLSPQVSQSTSAVLSVPLAPGRSYQWQVMAYGNPGSVSPASNLLSFSIHASASTHTSPPPAPPHLTGVSVTSRVGKKIKAITVSFDEALSSIGSSSARFFQLSQRKKAGKHPDYRPISDGPISYNPVAHTVRVQLRKPVVGPIRIVVLGGIQATNGTLSLPSSPVTRS